MNYFNDLHSRSALSCQLKSFLQIPSVNPVDQAVMIFTDVFPVRFAENKIKDMQGRGISGKPFPAVSAVRNEQALCLTHTFPGVSV